MTLDILQLAQGLARHATERQAVIARNVAHADTPGYRARDVVPFSEVLAKAQAPQAMRATRAGHIHDADAEGRIETVAISPASNESPNGNSVSLEDQMIRAADVKQSHDLALGVYRKSLDILRMSIGGR